MSDEHRPADANAPLEDLPARSESDAPEGGAEDVRGGAEQRTYTGGRFSLDVSGPNNGYLRKIGTNPLS